MQCFPICVFPSVPLCTLHSVTASLLQNVPPSVLVSNILGDFFWFSLSLSSFSVFLVDFIFLSLALLSSQLPQSHKPKLFCSRQPPITGLEELKGGDQQRDGAGVGVARALLLQQGRGDKQKRAEKCPSQ